MGGSQGISRARKRVKRRVRIDQIEDDNNTDDEQDLNYWMERRLRREAAADLVQKNLQQQEQDQKKTEETSERPRAENETIDHSDCSYIGDVVVKHQEKKKASTEGRSRRPDSIIVEGARSGRNKINNMPDNKSTSSKDDERIPQAKAPAVTKTVKEIETSRIERMRIKNQQRKAARKAKKAGKSL
mmetsp:Transcript_37637/g.38080  ORF Transcript_37637/g.38080 Transcript_37637/m.38080 type:complete len:186 (-) Transcript_37637:72-629(-)